MLSYEVDDRVDSSPALMNAKKQSIEAGSSPGPLFTFRDGSYSTRANFVELVRDGLQRVGVDQQRYCGHSFRIGAATTAAQKDFEDCIIKTLGRWESLAYLQYVKIPRDQLAGYSKLLAS